MDKDLTYFIDKINNITILAPFRANSDILIISDSSEYGIGASIFQLKNYNKINQYIQSSKQDIPNKNNDKNLNKNKKILSHDQKNITSHDQIFSKSINTVKNNDIFDLIFKNKNLNLTLDKIKESLFINSESYKKLQQEIEPIGFYSRILNKTEQKYSTFDRELLAIANTLEHYKWLIRNGQRIFILTDHKNLVYAVNRGAKVETNRKFRLFDIICQFNTYPIYIQGKDNQLADFLSRHILKMDDNSNSTSPYDQINNLAKDLEINNIYTYNEYYSKNPSSFLYHHPSYTLNNAHLIKMNRLLLDKITSLTKGATVSKNKISTSKLQNENHEKAMNNNSLQKQSQKRVRTEEENSDIPNKRNKGKEISHDLE